MKQAFIWAYDWLNLRGYSCSEPPDIIREVPWSQISRFVTTQGDVYLKWAAPAFALEASLLAYLGDNFSDTIVPILANNSELDVFLMPDCGEPLRQYIKRTGDVNILADIVKQYANIQIHCFNRINDLKALRLPDWGMQEFPKMYEELIQDHKLLHYEGLSRDELQALHHQGPELRRLCQSLENIGIPHSIEHCDFHDNNILIQHGHTRINDWGDAVISHPFFSIAGFLESAMRNHDFSSVSAPYLSIKKNYLHVWASHGTEDTLEDAFRIACVLRPVEQAFNFQRVYNFTSLQEFSPYQGYIAELLRKFLNRSG